MYRLDLDPAVADGMDAVGAEMVPGLVWAKTKNYSVMLKPAATEFPSFLEHIRSTIGDLKSDMTVKLPKRFKESVGKLLVLDPADVHIGKLCVESETGVRYDSQIAEHRLVEGCRMLIEKGVANGATSVLLVIGNDIAHIDTPKKTTTSGTPQDVDGTIFTIHRAAQVAYVRVITMALEMGLGVRVIFNPSNHDWVLGFTIAQFIRAWFHDHPNVDVSEYAVSERHRKYVRFGGNIMGFTHGDGAREVDLLPIMTSEVRPHMSEARHLYWYVHHYHHKIRKSLGVRSQSREKDHIGMTVIKSAAGSMEGDNCHIEYVRSPSAPDGWHDRNGYVGRQAVEAFVHCPFDGQDARFTEWF
ncbi:hypothetical protein QO034_18860 [Sedimentitalea sp. JM2-8]|uniref:Beta protein n=1 Tax=Sedimentitalea xiamensis TaxID=3050037 RepID=A0ABT7FJQ0_9RHOB|nr:hypothetical protein [Sedimentitalea xiamensis]MDK3075153.1 hypothetical protein [Sedimentitalea xiamensis]